VGNHIKNTVFVILVFAVVLPTCVVYDDRDEPFNPDGSPTTPVTRVSLNHTSLSMNVGDNNRSLYATVEPYHATNRGVTWTSSNPSVATVAIYDPENIYNSEIKAEGVGEAVITITTEDGGFTVECTVTVRPGIVSEYVTVTKEPNKTKFIVGEEFDFTGLEIMVNYVNNITIKYTAEEILLSPTEEDYTTLGPKYHCVEANGLFVGYIKVATVVEWVKLYISYGTEPNKKMYAIGEPLDLTGLEVFASYNDGSGGSYPYEDIPNTDLEISGFDSMSLGAKNITIAYYGKIATFTDGKTASFTVNVVNELSHIEITPPNKLEYIKGEALDLTGFAVNAVYNNGTESVPINNVVISGYNPGQLGRQFITVTYAGKSSGFTVNVIPPFVASVALDKNTIPLFVSGTETLTATVSPDDVGNKNISWSSNNPSVASVVSTGNTTALVTALSAGSATITVTTEDGGKTAQCTVTVTANNILSISFADFQDLVSEIEGPTIYTVNRNGRPTSATIEISDDIYQSVTWYYRGIPITSMVTHNGVIFIPNGTNIILNAGSASRIGEYLLTVEVRVGGKLYSKVVTFTVRP